MESNVNTRAANEGGREETEGIGGENDWKSHRRFG